MARQLRVQFPGAIYHVSCRMVGDASVGAANWPIEKRLFRDVADRERFLERLGERVEQFNIRLYLFVLMTNHFHLVFETPQANCSQFMQSLSTAYTVYHNLRHSRHGHLLDGRYKAKLVEGDDYLQELSRYVHLNPVQVGALKGMAIEKRIESLRAYPWSSYPSYIGRRKAFEFVDYDPLLGEMTGKRRERPKRYREFVESGLAETDDDFAVALKQSPRSIGSDGFRAWIDELYEQRVEAQARPEDASFRHITEPLPTGVVLDIVGESLDVACDEFRHRRRNSALRAVAAHCLIRFAGLSQRDVADLLGMGSGAAVCNQLTRLPNKLAKDGRLRRQVQHAETKLQTEKTARQKSQSAGHTCIVKG